jgi:hypothetical protein
MLDNLLAQLTLLNAVPPVPSVKNQREPLQTTDDTAIPPDPPVPPQKTDTKTKNKNTTRSKAKIALIKCCNCLNFKCFNAHGQGAGTCSAGVQPNGVAWWSESLHECAKFDAKIEHVELQPIPANTLTVICYTPAGNPLVVEARDEAHAEFLRKMNPKPTKGTPRDESD